DPALLAGDVLSRGHIDFARCGFGHLLDFDPWDTFEHARRAGLAFDEAQATRWRNVVLIFEALSYATLGDFAAADRASRAFMEGAVRMEEPYPLTFARTYWMLILAERDDPAHLEEASALARDLIARAASEVAVGAAWGALAQVSMMQGRLHEAREAAREALS